MPFSSTAEERRERRACFGPTRPHHQCGVACITSRTLLIIYFSMLYIYIYIYIWEGGGGGGEGDGNGKKIK